jgi:hypothetical protein
LSAFAFTAEDDHFIPAAASYHRDVILGLRRNRRLRVLKLKGRMGASDSSELVSVLENHNTTLAEIEGPRQGYESEADRAKIRRLLAVNRYVLGFDPDADFVANARRVPLGLWGDVLSRMGADRANRCVVELAQRAVAAAGAGGGGGGTPRAADLPPRRGAKRPRAPARG